MINDPSLELGHMVSAVTPVWNGFGSLVVFAIVAVVFAAFSGHR